MAVTVTFVKFSLSFVIFPTPAFSNALCSLKYDHAYHFSMECDIVWYLQNGPLVCFETLKPHFPMQMVSH